MAGDTAAGICFLKRVFCPATTADDGATDAVVITVLATEATVNVTAGLVLVTKLWVACVTFAGADEDVVSCAMFAFIEAPASCTTVGVPIVALD